MPQKIEAKEILKNKRERILQAQKYIRWGAIIFFIAIGIFLFIGYRNHWFKSPDVLKDFFLSLGHFGVVLSFLLVVINTIAPIIPGGLPALALFMIYGNINGFLLVLISNILGSLISFSLVKRYGETFVKAFVPDKLYHSLIAKIYNEKTATRLAILAFLIPGLPDDATVMICGLTNMRLRRLLVLCIVFKPIPTYLYLFGVTNIFQWILNIFL